MVRITTLLLTVLLYLCGWSNSWATLQVSADRNQISINDNLVIQVQQDGDEDEEPDFSPLDNDFEVLGRSQSSQIQIVNSTMSREKVWSLTVIPRRSGTLTIPVLCAGSDCSQPLTIEVLAQSQVAADDAEVLLEVEATPLAAMVQGQILYRVRLFHRLPLTQGSLSAPEPQGVETLLQKLGEDRRFETYRNGWRYQVIERSYALFPQQSGKLRLPPLRFEGQLQPSQRSRFDHFGQQGKIIRLRSDSIDINVQPPASNQHRWLPAQDLNADDSWQNNPPTLTVGEPATRTLTIRAAGITAAQLPDLILSAPEVFKQYPDQAAREDIIDQNGISGVVVQKVALVPTRAGTFELPELSLTWWDVVEKKWRTQTIAAVTLQVLPAQRQAMAVPPPPPTIEPPEQTVQPAPAASETAAATSLAAQSKPSIWMWISLLCGSGWLITGGLWFRQRRRHQLTTEPPPPPTTKHNPAAIKKQLLSSAQANQAHATRDTLLQWGRQLWPEQDAINLETWQQRTEGELRRQIDELSAALYSADQQSWQGQPLAEALDQWQPPATASKASELPSFYPTLR
ncbi:MAG: protein BatD [Desulfuromonas sp.]|nr:protein BatD [Desulfuromonas sp.]